MNLLSNRIKLVLGRLANEDEALCRTVLIQSSGASKSVVSQWEKGKIKSIDIEYALNIERNLGINHIWLMTGDGEIEVNKASETGQQFNITNIPKQFSDIDRMWLSLLANLGSDDIQEFANKISERQERNKKLIAEMSGNASEHSQQSKVTLNQETELLFIFRSLKPDQQAALLMSAKTIHTRNISERSIPDIAQDGTN